MPIVKFKLASVCLEKGDEFDQAFAPTVPATRVGGRSSTNYAQIIETIFDQKFEMRMGGCWKFCYLTIFLKKTIFSEETVKNCSEGTFDYFLGKWGV